MKEILEQSLFDVPYNSFGKIILSSGENYPLSYGWNCVFQCRQITTRLINSLLDEAKIRYVTASEKPHWVIVIEDGDTYMLDPFLLCPEPINISKVLKWEKLILDAYPIGNNKIEVSMVDAHNLQIKLFIKKWAGYKQVLEYTYNIDNWTSRDLPPDDYQLLANLCQKNLEMWILMNQENWWEVIRLYRVPGQWNLDIRVIWGQHFSNIKNQSGFEQQKSRIISRLNTTEEEFDKTWTLGERLYLERQLDICRLREKKGA